MTDKVPVYGRVRMPDAREDADPNAMFLANAVLEVRPIGSLALSPLARRVAGFIDGFRPVARIKTKAALTSDELLDGLAGLREHNLLVLVGVVEEVANPSPEIRSGPVVEETVPKASGEIIPAHVMNEITAMLAEEDERRRAAEFEDVKTVAEKIPRD